MCAYVHDAHAATLPQDATHQARRTRRTRRARRATRAQPVPSPSESASASPDAPQPPTGAPASDSSGRCSVSLCNTSNDPAIFNPCCDGMVCSDFGQCVVVPTIQCPTGNVRTQCNRDRRNERSILFNQARDAAIADGIVCSTSFPSADRPCCNGFEEVDDECVAVSA